MKLNTAPRIHASLLILGASIFLLTACNGNFWRTFFSATGGVSLSHLPLHLASFLLLVFLFNACLNLISFRFIVKPVLVVLFMATSATYYFMNEYGTAIDKSMIQNLLETDVHEALELLNWKLLLTITVLGIIPSLLVCRADVRFCAGKRGLMLQAANIGGSLLMASVLLFLFFKSLAPALREHRELRYLLAPTNYIQAINGYIKQQRAQALVMAPLGMDATKRVVGSGNRQRSVTLIVVGETARAANFSLNGYARATNPKLSAQPGLLNFTDVQSCGTATAVSVPCVFSALGRENYSDDKAHAQQGLLDVLSHAGFSVLWRDNNSGCKGACDRVDYEDLSKPETGTQASKRWCVDDECFDERLLDGLPELIRKGRQDMVIVLHQKGSHGPAYWKRAPAAFQRFGPVCQTNQLESCSRESIVAAYDNSILYTDHFLNQAIELLKASAEEERINTAMLYFSDHGESLGEHNMYLHGAPYVISPAEQRAVPFMLWLSDGFRSRFHIDQRCLAARTGQAFSHDNVFHSVLGMHSIGTAVYNPGLDIFGPCTHET
ncbi:phosphoethanolamine--lipid A transferase [Massilia sp. CCM 9210]|uniref:phosphoethanolamine transferase n=1 Tax=Massilia scottii TaxID=3057166 RepID=UPI002796ABD8|nr:phosphoethanolamine--lipid A transferase [Massilia sp. CCM 9210]MDQ1813889.1 phosphoethanolamine--lipid A transferase [Massilia sp. CCM 9210]